ncbi:MAG: HAD-IIIC family phosphatase [Ruminococcaceae bacterium]|nr:HAD-IIIC family phosphatase [Oscillospiraceae bacterium]
MDNKKIVELLAGELEISPAELENYKSELNEIGLTSLKFISFIVKLEEKFDIEILDSDLLMDNFITIDKLFGTLKKYFSEPQVTKKCLILDADGVLWKGISGEDDIVIDVEVLAFQSVLKDLYRRGVLLCICSKNENFLIERSLEHPKMLLTKENFACITANRNDKVTNIRAISDELNMTLDAMAFVDDSDYELGFVGINLPEVECIKLDYSDSSVIERITSIFSDVQPTSDLNRTQLYHEQKEREKDKLRFTSPEEYNSSLMTRVRVARAELAQCARLSELSSRTHQFNLSAKSYTEDELQRMLANEACDIFVLDAADKYGDMGIVGMAVLRDNVIEAFMLSCRVFDRGFDYMLLDAVKSASAQQISGIYTATEKNKRFADFYKSNGVATV